MAKVTITIEDTDDDSLKATLNFEPPISLESIEKPTHAINFAALIMHRLKDMGETKLYVNGMEKEFKL